MVYIYQIRSIEHRHEYFPDMVSLKGKKGITMYVKQRYIW